ncbi:hypothetical protein TcasGA2_TC003503 [Tribolium castaneum]|uniref:Torsin-like protein n=1 Tax=Tribolium castaneum TaxID=7070 RepID=D6WH36_TRICA|nr:PREDICTED: uncharacterized protein LOC103312340 [Tribolium castaneum]EFA00627.1 hypothetical protein TcasGA2_TC003503 [Tribolium castaneum]|eukprot:XP_008190971.1 PREDICTED: uncharacterized protein LOC103312340 [Tribolium castaneum]
MKNRSDGKAPVKKPGSRRAPRAESQDETSLGSAAIRHSGYISTFILLISTLLIYDLIVSTSENVDFEALKADLRTSVYNQSDSVRVITERLDQIQKQDHAVDVICFIGSTGVGKTFTANILKKHFSPFTYELRTPLRNEEIFSTIKRNYFKHNLLIIDDLTLEDVDNLVLFVKSVPQDVRVLVVCIFNIQETDSLLNHRISYDHVDKIVDKLNLAEISYTAAKFHEFTEDQVRGWVLKQLEIKGVDKQFHSKIVQTVVGNQNVRYNGLKGLNSKILLEL